jgi:hypothetical protein
MIKTNMRGAGFVVMLAALFLASCSRGGRDALIGSWTAENGQGFVFQTNGTFRMTIPPPSSDTNAHYFTNLNGTYTILDSRHIKLELQIWDGQFIGVSTNYFAISGNKMNFQLVGGQTNTEFHRENLPTPASR